MYATIEHGTKTLQIRYSRDGRTRYSYFVGPIPAADDVLAGMGIDPSQVGIDSLDWLVRRLGRMRAEGATTDALPCLMREQVGDWRLVSLCDHGQDARE